MTTNDQAASPKTPSAPSSPTPTQSAPGDAASDAEAAASLVLALTGSDNASDMPAVTRSRGLRFVRDVLTFMLDGAPDEQKLEITLGATHELVEERLQGILRGDGDGALAEGGLNLTASEDALLRTLLGAARDDGLPVDPDASVNQLILLPSRLPAHSSSVDSTNVLGAVGDALRIGCDAIQHFGEQCFVERADNTARALVGSVRAVQALMTLVGLKQLDGSLEPVGNDIDPKDLVSVALAHSFRALSQLRHQNDRVEQLRDDLVAERQQRGQLEDRLADLESRYHHRGQRLVQLREECDETEERSKTLEEDLQHARERIERLSKSNRSLREREATADTKLTEEQLKDLYQFIFEHGRMVSSSDELYQLLRAAATRDPTAAPTGAWVNLAIVPDGHVGTSPPAMESLPSYQRLESATSVDTGDPTTTGAAEARMTTGSPIRPASPTPSRLGKRKAARLSSDRLKARRLQNRENSRLITEALQDGTNQSSVVDVDLEDDEEDEDAEDEDEEAGSDDVEEDKSVVNVDSSDDDDDEDESQLRRRRLANAKLARSGTRASPSNARHARATVASLKSRARPIDTGRLLLAGSTAQASSAPARQPVITGLSHEAIALCVKVPGRPKSAAATETEFAHVDIPVRLGQARGYSSTVDYHDATVRHFKKVDQFSTQLQAPQQSVFFPNYEVFKGQTKLVAGNLGKNPYDQLDTLLAAAPWDDEWTKRSRHIYMFDPNQLSREQVEYLELVWTFMFQFRKEYWTRSHWLVISRDHKNAQLDEYFTTRQAADTAFLNLARRLRDAAPRGMSMLLWSEPAFWFVPDRPCTWIVRPVWETPILDQLEELDELEPIRANWTNVPGRFVEALLPQQLDLLDQQDGKCWEVMAPWNDPQYQPPRNRSWPAGGAAQ